MITISFFSWIQTFPDRCKKKNKRDDLLWLAEINYRCVSIGLFRCASRSIASENYDGNAIVRFKIPIRRVLVDSKGMETAVFASSLTCWLSCQPAENPHKLENLVIFTKVRTFDGNTRFESLLMRISQWLEWLLDGNMTNEANSACLLCQRYVFI